MTENLEKKSKSKGILFFFVTISILLILISGLFFLKYAADQAFMSNLINAVAATSDLDKVILDLEAEIKKPVTNPIPYDANNFSINVELLQSFKNGYLTLKDLENLAVELPQVQILFFQMGFKKIMVNEQHSKIMILSARILLKNMTKEDFGDDVDKWREWQKQKDESK